MEKWYMWSAKKQRVCITIDDQAFSILLIPKDGVFGQPATLYIERFELYDGLIFNPTRLQHFLKDFVNRNNSIGMEAVVLVSGSFIYEQVAQQPDTSFDDHYFGEWVELHDQCWYGVGMSRFLWLQINMLFESVDIHIVALVPLFLARMHVVFDAVKVMDVACSDVHNLHRIVEDVFNKKYQYELDQKFVIPALAMLFDT